MPKDPNDACLDGLFYLTILTFACSHNVEFHSIVPPQEEDFRVLLNQECPWCVAAKIAPDEIDRHHFHMPHGYRRGDAALKRSSLSPQQYLALAALDNEIEKEITDGTFETE